MAIMRYRAASPVQHLRDEMDDLFGRFFGEWGGNDVAKAQPGLPLDISEHDDKFEITAELPGVEPDNVDISVLDNQLVISGEKKREHKTQEEGYYHSERTYGSFRRELALPRSVDAEKVEARFKNGVLTISLPKSEKEMPRKINVQPE